MRKSTRNLKACLLIKVQTKTRWLVVDIESILGNIGEIMLKKVYYLLFWVKPIVVCWHPFDFAS